MDFDLSNEQRLIQETVRDFARSEVAPVAEDLDRTKSFPYEIVARMSELGFMGIPFPEEYGGGGADTLSYAIAVEELARIDSSVAITVAANTSLGTSPIFYWGSDEQKQEWLPDLCTGKRLGAFGLTEPEAGSDAGNTKTRAELVDGEWVINGAKQFITNSGTDISACVTITAVTGQTEKGPEISNLIVPNGTAGYEIGEPYRKMGWHASDTHGLTFVDCAVPADHLLGAEGRGFANFLSILDEGRVAIAAMAVGVIQGCLEECQRYANERIAFGRAIGANQAIAFAVADLAVSAEAARLLTYRAAALADAGRPYKTEAAMAKLYATEAAVTATRTATQVFGGSGYMDETPVARHYRDAKVLEIGEGTSEVQRLVISRALGLPVR